MEIKGFVTSKNCKMRLSRGDEIIFSESSNGELVTLNVDRDQRYQQIEGFGGAFTESAALNFAALEPDLQERFLHTYFDPMEGLGYTLCRTHINSCDFSEGNYSFDDVEGDVELKFFSIDRDLKFLIPLIHRAQKLIGDKFKLLATPWSPPGWMKTTGRMNYGGKLLPQHYQTWANYLLRYIREYEKQGVKIWGMTIQNEPESKTLWESCLYSAEDEAKFIGCYLGPLLESEGLGDLKIICCDENRCKILDRAQIIYKDPLAYKYIWGAGFHWYCHSGYSDLLSLNRLYPDKKLLFTEGTITGGTYMGSWELGERYAESMIHDFNSWATGWIDWNILLDQNGGPNHIGNFCSAPIIFDSDKKSLIFQSSYYYIGHFSKFIKPGAFRITCKTATNEISATAFENPDDEIVIIVLNRKEYDVGINLNLEGEILGLNIPARGIITLCVGK